MSHPYESFMREAAELAERGRWSAAPNPTVGAVLVRDGVAVARGWHTAYGKSHAEVECLKDAEAKGVDPSACTLVVTLEPCNHQGQTPPCTEAVIAAGIRHVVIGLRDPNPKAAGGMERLAEAGVEVEAGVCEELCRDLVADFLIWQTTKRPYVMLKLAMTLDGRIATRTGHSRWITGETARHQVHELRANVGRAGGAILVGGNTLHTDNPLLTARLDDPVERQPLAVSISSRVPAPDSLLLFKERPTETIFFTTASGAATPRAAQLRERGVRIRGLDRWKSGEDLVQILEYLRQEAGCPYVLCEGGGRLGLSLLEAGLVDEFHLHIAPKVLGDNDARPLNWTRRSHCGWSAWSPVERTDTSYSGRCAHVHRHNQRSGESAGGGIPWARDPVSDSGALRPRGHYFGRIHCRQRNVSYSRNVWSEPFFRLCVR